MDFKIRIINAQYKLSDTENEIADYIRRNPSDLINSSISDLSKRFYTVPNTITRLCKKLGYSGYSELKIELKQEYNSPRTQLNERKIINNTFDLIDEKREQFVADKIKDANRILIFAVGETAYPVQEFASTVNAFNHKTTFYIYENQIIADLKNSSKELVLLVSISGQNSQLLRTAKIAKELGHFVISLTHISNNPLEQLSDLALYCYSPAKVVNGINITDKAPVYIVLNSLKNTYISQNV